MAATPDDLWDGTSDSRAVIAARLRSTPAERLEWLGEALEVLEASGALARVRRTRQRESDEWWVSSGGSAELPVAPPHAQAEGT